LIYGFASVDVGLWSDLSRGIPVTDWSARIGRHITADGSVIVPPRIADWIEGQIGLVSERRTALAGTDPLAYTVLSALRIVALPHRSGNGTKLAGGQPTSEDSEQWLTTSEAAAQMGVTDRAVRKWIAQDRLPAKRYGGRWMKATLLLCDNCVVADGKLFISGGGWSVVSPNVKGYMALLIAVPWDLANQDLSFELKLLDEDGQPVRTPNNLGEDAPIELSAALQVGRPAGLVRGITLDVPLAVQMPHLVLTPGRRFEWVLTINGESKEDWRMPFLVVARPQ
jgi:excisionase family DNA binding protein